MNSSVEKIRSLIERGGERSRETGVNQFVFERESEKWLALSRFPIPRPLRRLLA